MPRYYLCNVCGNMVEMIEDKGNNPYCCNRPMQLQQPGMTDGAKEKHIPVIDIVPMDENICKVIIDVGSIAHPMDSLHYIQWITLQTDKGTHYSKLSPTCQPKATFYIGAKEVILSAYAYCNLHGLWKVEKAL